MISGAVEKLFSPFARGILFVGFSGGADSTAALLAVWNWRSRHPECTVEAVHFNHCLRGGESDREAAAAREFAESRRIPFRCVELEVSDAGSGLEAAAREARLNEWKRLCSGKRAVAVVLGHNAGDRVENMLIRLFRGSNTSALTALRPRSTVCGVVFLRPLLEFSRGEIEAFLREEGVNCWQSDSSNLSGDFSRNYWRNTLLPMIFRRFPWSRSGVDRALEALEMDAQFIEAAAEEYYASGDPESGIFWRNAAPALRPRLLRRFMTGHFGVDMIPTPAVLARLESALAGGARGAGVEIPVHGGVSLFFENDRLGTRREVPSDMCWRWREEPVLRWGGWRLERRWECRPEASGIDSACFDAALLPDELMVGCARPGERMIPFGRRSPELLRKLRIDRGVKAGESPPVLRDVFGTVWWMCGVRRSSSAPVSVTTAEPVCFMATKG